MILQTAEPIESPVAGPHPAAGTMGCMARYALRSGALPRMPMLMAFTAKVHGALCALSDTGKGSSPTFSGRSAAGTPLRRHEHAYLFCDAAGHDDAITHLYVWAGEDLDAQALIALTRLSKVWGHGGPDVYLRLEGIGQAEVLAPAALLGPAQEWAAYTPFISSRHAKTYRDGRAKHDPHNGLLIGSAPHELARLLALDQRFAGAAIRTVQDDHPFQYGTSRHAPGAFRTARTDRGGTRGESHGWAFTIRFPQPVAGPIALGFGAHFGLGMFRAVEPKEVNGATLSPSNHIPSRS